MKRKSKLKVARQLASGEQGVCRGQNRGIPFQSSLSVLILCMLACGGGGGSTGITPSPPPSAIWSAGMETGDLSEWYLPSTGPFGNNGGSEENSGIADASASRDVAHRGLFSAKLTITTPSSPESGTRLFRWREPQTHSELYYSVWYYFPQAYAVSVFWNALQWKSARVVNGVVAPSDAFFNLSVTNLADRRMVFFLQDSQQGISHNQSFESAQVIPERRWFHIEAFYRCGGDNTGRVTIWQDGVRIFDITDVQTRHADGDCRWSVNSLSSGLIPNTATIYIDDAAISRTRVGASASQ